MASEEMTARDYQHKRFANKTRSPEEEKSPGKRISIDERPLGRAKLAIDDHSDSGHCSIGSKSSYELSNAMKNMIQPFMHGDSAVSPKLRSQQQDQLSDYIHAPTANGKSPTVINNSPSDSIKSLTAPLGKPASALRFSLKDGMDEDMKRTSEGMMKASQRSKLRAVHSLALKHNHNTDPATPTSASSSPVTSPSSTTSSPRRSSTNAIESDPNAYKIFLLLLQPKSKIFELIQLLYSPSSTTIGNIITMIPDNATEDALGSQKYIGLCRPKERHELMNMDQLASIAPDSADIKLGEILVAIPVKYSGADVARLSEQILANPRIVKLLKRSDPLAPKSKRRSRHRSSRHRSSTGSASSSKTGGSGSSRRRRRSSSSKNSVEILDKHDERDEIEQERSDKKMRDAMAHAAAEAAAANAAIPDALGGNGGMRLRRVGSISSYSDKSYSGMSTQESLDDSYSSWSKSFEESFSAQSSICSGVSKRALRRRERHARRIAILKKTAVCAILVMVALFFVDPRGYSGPTESEMVSTAPMGLIGFFQTFFLLLTIYKVQRFFRTDGGEYGKDRRCPFLRASTHAMDGLRSRYAARLSKVEDSPVPSSPASTAELSQRLRHFSLKAHGITTDDDTGSL